MTSTTYGTIQYDSKTSKWVIDALPHVRARLRRFFESAKNSSGNLVRIDATQQSCRDIEWFMQRYPFQIASHHQSVLKHMANAQRQQEADSLAIVTGTTILPPVPLTTPLREYQRIGLDLLRTVRGLMCADDMGLGKTAIGVAAAAFAPPALVVCNTHTQEQWRRQIKKFAAGLRVRTAPTTRPEDLGNYDVLIIPYSKLAGWRDHLAGTIKTVIFDEMQDLRHHGTNKHAAACHVAEGAEYRIGLTGTPIYNYGGEIFSTMDILRPGELGTADEFHREWCTFLGKDKWIVNDPAALRAFMLESGMLIRRTRAEVGRELPPVVKVQHRVPFNKAVLECLREDALQLAQTILSQSADFNAKGIAARELDIKLRKATGIAKAPFVAEMVIDLCKDGQKVVLGAWHREVWDILLYKLSHAGVPAWMYTGSESTVQKTASVDAFIACEGGAVLGMSLRSGAGLDGLQHVSNTVIYAELDWSPQVHDQLSARVARDEQKNGVTIIYCTVDAGSDPIIASVLGIKTEQHLGIIDGTAPSETIDTQAIQSRISKMAADFVKRNSPGYKESEE